MVGDSVVVLDRTSRRLSIFAPGDRYLRSVGIATISALGFSVLGDNRIIVAGLSSTPQAVGYGLHLVAPGDLPPQPFGTRESVVTPERQAWLRRVTTPANARGAVWASRAPRCLRQRGVPSTTGPHILGLGGAVVTRYQTGE